VAGSEMAGTRPAIVVSNNKANQFAPVVTVVWLCSNERKPLQTHCTVKALKSSTAVCENVTTVSKERIGGYIRTATEDEIDAVDRCLRIHMDLVERRTKEEILDRQQPENIDEMIAILGVAPVIGYLRCKLIEHRADTKKSEWYMNKLMELKRHDTIHESIKR
jgi:mRNA-degrading endonuclease toxin of MazEF toxin-antitoxin module